MAHTGNAAFNVALLGIVLASAAGTRNFRTELLHRDAEVPGEGVTAFADGLGAMHSKPEHHDAADAAHGGKPGAGGKPMVPRTHEAVADEKHEWTYANPGDWAGGYKDCGGKAQSPINIDTLEIHHEHVDDKLNVAYHGLDARHLDNNGHNLQVNGAFGTLSLPDGEYNVAQFHFHFPSEHEVDGQLAAGEIHIVHQKVGATGTDGLAVVGILLQENAEQNDLAENEAFLTLLGFDGHLPKEHDARAIMGTVDLQQAFGQELGGSYYHYEGSLTTPPCSETVHWFVLSRPAAVTPGMVQQFKSLFPSPTNNRPVQSLNSRDVVESEFETRGQTHKQPGEKSRASGASAAAWVLMLALGFAMRD